MCGLCFSLIVLSRNEYPPRESARAVDWLQHQSMPILILQSSHLITPLQISRWVAE